MGQTIKSKTIKSKISELVFRIIVMATKFEKEAIENIWLKGLKGWFFFYHRKMSERLVDIFYHKR